MTSSISSSSSSPSPNSSLTSVDCIYAGHRFGEHCKISFKSEVNGMASPIFDLRPILLNQIKAVAQNALNELVPSTLIDICLAYISLETPFCRFDNLTESAGKAPEKRLVDNRRVMTFSEPVTNLTYSSIGGPNFWLRSFMELRVFVIETSALQRLSWCVEPHLNQETDVVLQTTVSGQGGASQNMPLMIFRGSSAKPEDGSFMQAGRENLESPFFMVSYPAQRSASLKFFDSEFNRGKHPVVDQAAKESLDQDKGIDLFLWNGLVFYTICKIPTDPQAPNFAATMLKLANIYQSYL